MYKLFAIRCCESGTYFKQERLNRRLNHVPTKDINESTRYYSLKEAIYKLVNDFKEFKSFGDTFEIVEFAYKDYFQSKKANISTIHLLDMEKIINFSKIIKVQNLGYYKKSIFNYLYNKKNGHKTKYFVYITGEKVKAKDFPFRRGSFYAMHPIYDGRYIFLFDDDQLMLVKLTYSDYTLYTV